MKAYRLLYCLTVAVVLVVVPHASASEPMFTDMDLFLSGHDNVNIYRIPSLMVAPSGTLLAFIEARHGDDGDPTDLMLKRSPYAPPRPPRNLNGYPRVFGYGVNWEPMRTVLPGKGHAIMNPCPVLDQGTGRVHPYEKVAFARFSAQWLAGEKPRMIIPCGGGGWKDGQVQEPCILVNPKDAGKLDHVLCRNEARRRQGMPCQGVGRRLRPLHLA